MYGSPCNKYRTLQRVTGVTVAIHGQGSDEPFSREDSFRAGVHYHKAACAVGVLYFAFAKAHLPKKGGLLISGYSEYWDTGEGRDGLYDPIVIERFSDLRKDGEGYLKQVTKLFIPSLLHDIEKEGPGSIGIIGCVQPPSCQFPDEPTVNSAEEYVIRPILRHVFKNPPYLCTAKIGIHRETGPALEKRSMITEPLAIPGSSSALPNNGIIDGYAVLPVP